MNWSCRDRDEHVSSMIPNIAHNNPETHTHHHSQQISLQPKTQKVTNIIPLNVHHFETTLPIATCRTLALLRTNKYPLLRSYLNKIDENKHPSPLCPHCKTEPHTTNFFNCIKINTHLKVRDLWTAPVEMGSLLAKWKGWIEGGYHQPASL